MKSALFLICLSMFSFNLFASPVVGVTDAPAINSANVNFYTVRGICSENGRLVEVEIAGESSLYQPFCIQGAWNASFNLERVKDGKALMLIAKHFSDDGNLSTIGHFVIKDTVRPTVAITNAPVITHSNLSSYFVSGVCSEQGLPVRVEIPNLNFVKNVKCMAGTWSVAIDLTTASMNDLKNVMITVDSTDQVGNQAYQGVTIVSTK